MKAETLIVVATLDEGFLEFRNTLKGGEVRVVSTAEGGHPSAAFIRAYRDNSMYESFLFVQDSMEGIADDVVQPFRNQGEVVAWCDFHFSYDDPIQAEWVRSQYPDQPEPRRGIFGPVFYATKEAMWEAEPFFPKPPQNKHQAQGTERAWAYAFQSAGVRVAALHDYDRAAMEAGDYHPFRKVFANRP